MKFPKSSTAKNQFNDVILQAHHNGIVLKSASNSGVIMTRCMIRTEFFTENSFRFADVVRPPYRRKQLKDTGKIRNVFIYGIF